MKEETDIDHIMGDVEIHRHVLSLSLRSQRNSHECGQIEVCKILFLGYMFTVSIFFTVSGYFAIRRNSSSVKGFCV
jgi:hypothetical protein